MLEVRPRAGEGIGEKPSVRAVRDELVGSIDRWRAGFDEADAAPSTLWIGVALRAVTLAATMLSIAVSQLAPDAPLPPKPTLGSLVDTLVREAATKRITCLGTGRRLLRPAEIQLLHRLPRLRASIAHQEDAAVLWEAARIGRLGVADVAEFLDLAEQLCRLPLVDELVCRENLAPPSDGGAP